MSCWACSQLLCMCVISANPMGVLYDLSAKNLRRTSYVQT